MEDEVYKYLAKLWRRGARLVSALRAPKIDQEVRAVRDELAEFQELSPNDRKALLERAGYNLQLPLDWYWQLQYRLEQEFRPVFDRNRSIIFTIALLALSALDIYLSYKVEGRLRSSNSNFVFQLFMHYPHWILFLMPLPMLWWLGGIRNKFFFWERVVLLLPFILVTLFYAYILFLFFVIGTEVVTFPYGYSVERCYQGPEKMALVVESLRATHMSSVEFSDLARCYSKCNTAQEIRTMAEQIAEHQRYSRSFEGYRDLVLDYADDCLNSFKKDFREAITQLEADIREYFNRPSAPKSPRTYSATDMKEMVERFRRNMPKR